MRGEYILSLTWAKPPWELPPRARRIHIEFDLGKAPVGTTSACAENTGLLRLINPPKGNYLRVRGEYGGILFKASTLVELPPRARRIPRDVPVQDQAAGTTSACAENTWIVALLLLGLRNYLRVRGEYP